MACDSTKLKKKKEKKKHMKTAKQRELRNSLNKFHCSASCANAFRSALLTHRGWCTVQQGKVTNGKAGN